MGRALGLTLGLVVRRVMLRLLQDLYEADALSEETFTKWQDDVKDQTPKKVCTERGQSSF